MKRLLLAIPLLALLLASCNRTEKFDKDLYEGYYSALYSMEISKMVASNTADEWHKAVYGSGDVNGAIRNVLQGYKDQGIADSLNYYTKRMDSLTSELADPPSDRKEVYDDFVRLVGEVNTLYNYAANPTGNFNNYTNGLAQQIAVTERLNSEFVLKHSKYIKKK